MLCIFNPCLEFTFSFLLGKFPYSLGSPLKMSLPLALSRDGCFFLCLYFSVFPDSFRTFFLVSCIPGFESQASDLITHCVPSAPVFHQLSIVVALGFPISLSSDHLLSDLAFYPTSCLHTALNATS